jgi:hypothetical protein
MFNIKFGAEAASRYGSGTRKMMRLHAAPARPHSTGNITGNPVLISKTTKLILLDSLLQEISI